MKKRLYLDNCSYNRPYDDQSFLRNSLEAEAKIYIQKGILLEKFELAWSYILDYEVSFNPFLERKNQIMKWKNIAIIDIDESKKIINMAIEIMEKNVKPKDSLHIACAIEASCNFFITTDNNLIKKTIKNIEIIDPVNFIRIIEA